MRHRASGTAHSQAFRSGVPTAGPRPGYSERPAQKRPALKWDFLMYVAAGLIFVGHARIHSFFPGVSVLRPAMLLSALGIVAWFLAKGRGRSVARLLEEPMVRAGGFVVLWAIVGIPFSMSLGGSATFVMENLVRTFLVFLIVVAAVRDQEDVRRLVAALGVGVVLFAFLAPIERYTGGGAGGYDPNDGAMFMVSGIPLLAFFMLHSRIPWMRIVAALGVLAAIGAIVASQSRGGFLALAVVLAFMVFMLKTIKPAARIGIVAFVVLATVPVASSDYWDRVQTIVELDDGYGGEAGVGGRRATWARGISFTMANPVTGIGVGMYRRAEGQARGAAGVAARWRAAHSTWIEAMAELGVPGFMAFLAMFGFGLKTLWQTQRTRWHPPPPVFMPSRDFLTLGGFLLASLIGTMVAGSFLSHAYSGLVWGLLALIAGYAKVLREHLARKGNG